jgi:AcrR family transcriptional regulator
MLEAMLRVAAEKGYEATLVADVARAAGVTEAVFFETFGDKEGCFLESYDAMIDLLVSRVSNAFVGTVDCPWPERVGAGLRALVELLSSEPEIARMAMVEVTAIGEDTRERYRAALDRFVPFLDEGRAYSGQGDALPADTARLAVGGATSMIFEEVRAGRGAELERVLPELVFAVLMPYLGSEAAEEEMRRVAGERNKGA